MHLVSLVLLALVAMAQAQITSLGGCPTIVPMPNFDIKKFTGRWFEQFKYYNGQESNSVCASTDIAVNGTAVTITSRMIELSTRTEKIQIGNAAVPGTDGKIPAVFPNNNAVVYNVINTDYLNYAAIFTCQDHFFFNIKNAYIWTKAKHPVPSVLDASFVPFNTSGIDLGALGKSEQSFCPLPNYP